jgi:hypothetical protein
LLLGALRQVELDDDDAIAHGCVLHALPQHRGYWGRWRRGGLCGGGCGVFFANVDGLDEARPVADGRPRWAMHSTQVFTLYNPHLPF